MTDDDERELAIELARLQQDHRDLDAAIDALHQSPAPDLLRLQRLKKRKLQRRDRIAFIEGQNTPCIIPSIVNPGWSEGPDLRSAIAHRGISRFRFRSLRSRPGMTAFNTSPLSP